MFCISTAVKLNVSVSVSPLTTTYACSHNISSPKMPDMQLMSKKPRFSRLTEAPEGRKEKRPTPAAVCALRFCGCHLSLIISQSEIVKTSYEKSSGNESEIAKSKRDLIGYIHVVRQSGLHNCVNNITKFTHDNGNRNGMRLAL